jgi:hypothetical protein
MNERPRSATPRWVHQIANEISGLVQQQIDTLQQGLVEGDLQEYIERRGQIDKLQGEVRNLRRQPS